MIDLHLHLDGSLPLPFVKEQAKREGIFLSEKELLAAVTAPADCKSLNEYLRCFALPVRLLQSKEALSEASYTLAYRLAEEGLWYAEVRFAPQLHTERGMTQAQAVEAVLSGLRKAMGEKDGFAAQAILCCMRGGGDEKNRETVKTAEKFLGQGVCALDLAGAEALYPTREHWELFRYAASLGLPFTLHAGEADGPQSIRDALSCGAVRIGHGVRAAEDPVLMRELAERQIPLELCYTSNLQTKAVHGPEAFPLREFLRQGIKVTLNTDNRTVSNVSLSGEYKVLGVTAQERKLLLGNAVEAAFLPEEEKAKLRERLSRMG